ncbi:MAG: hypothetical protein LBC53_00450 [Spirochaetaceae bacterium]|jgi:serine/threonine protein kinase|nr:hypothetical protein [Spirochaetaceae bacterium]
MKFRAKGEIIEFVRQKDYIFDRYIDEGGFGKTALLKDPTMDEYFVCKKYEPQPGIDKIEYYENFKNEIKIMYKLFHRNIVRILDLFANPVGCRPSLAKCLAFCVFKRKLFGNLRFPNNSIQLLFVSKISNRLYSNGFH